MENNHTIIVDTLGSDKGPLEIIEGAKLLLENFSDLHIVLVGDEELIKQNNITLRMHSMPQLIQNSKWPHLEMMQVYMALHAVYLANNM